MSGSVDKVSMVLASEVVFSDTSACTSLYCSLNSQCVLLTVRRAHGAICAHDSGVILLKYRATPGAKILLSHSITYCNTMFLHIKFCFTSTGFALTQRGTKFGNKHLR